MPGVDRLMSQLSYGGDDIRLMEGSDIIGISLISPPNIEKIYDATR